jgi:hypothetical protein
VSRFGWKAVAFERISAVNGSNDPPATKGLSRFSFLEDDLHIWPGLAA